MDLMKKSYVLTISRWDPIIKNHLIHGQALLPGLAYVDILYQSAQENMGLDFREHCIKRLSIFNPLFMEEDRQVEIRVSFEKMIGYWYIKVEGTEKNNQGEPLQDKLYVTAELHEEAVMFKEQINIETMKQAATQTVDIETVYVEARKCGLIHEGMIKAKGNIYLNDNECLIELNVDDTYRDEAKKFLFHPTLIDGAAMASGVLEVKGVFGNEEDLYLPLYYESFSCTESLHTECYAVVSLSSFQKINDIFTMDITFFNVEGKQIAQLKGFTGKLIRNKGQIAPETPEHIKSIVRNIFSKYLHREPFQIDLDVGFFELGLESAQLLSVVKDIESAFNLSLNPTLLFENSNLRELIIYLDKKKEAFLSDSNTYEFYEHEAFLQEHLVCGQPALMDVVHPCLVLQTYIQNNPQSYPVELKNIQFEGGPVILNKTEKVFVQVQVNKEKKQTGFKTIHYTTEPGNSKLCCQGEHIGPVNASPDVIDIKALLNQSKPMERDAINRCNHIINNFTTGPMLQIDSVSKYDDSTVIGKVCLSGESKKGNVSQFILDPIMLNCCYLLNSIVDNENSDDILVPFLIENLTIFRPMKETAYIVKTFRCRRNDFVSFDAMLLTETGDIIAEVINASLKKVIDLSVLTNQSFNTMAFKQAFITDKVNVGKAEENDIAIVGLAGRYPGAYDINAFWENLRSGIDCITEIPEERWVWEDYYSEDRTKPGHIYSKWGGFIEDVDRFDPLFFKISPREAAIMDPQERLFLEQCWIALEDAGYTKTKLQQTAEPDLPNQVGVYVGVMSQEYPLSAAASNAGGNRLGFNSGMASIANRVSHFFNFHGPSMAIDTMCSSSLTAIYLACQALKEKDVNVALAGGVNITIHPNKYLFLSQGQFISSKGHCESFGEGGDGYIPGEGVGVLVLKRLVDAERDKDNIYGVIKGVAINHGGRSGGYTVPNQRAQSSVISKALKGAGVKPRTINYIEAHGTGTVLGDPIEIAALTQAFEQDTKDKQFCAIGSVKSNIGHCESAAGVAGVTKVLLQIKYGQLVPSLHSEVLNPNIDFRDTPFMVQQELAEWKRPVVQVNGQTTEYPRIAGISAFGAGGSNAHIIIAEYIPDNQKTTAKLTPTVSLKEILKKVYQGTMDIEQACQLLEQSG